MHDADENIFAEALAATNPSLVVRSDFVNRVMARKTQRRNARLRIAQIAGLIAVAAMVLFAWSRRSIVGSIEVPLTTGEQTTVALGSRARMVVEPGTIASWRVGGLSRSDIDRVDLVQGAAFFRVDRGGEFEVRTRFATVVITGTCFRVAVTSDHEGDPMERLARARWFGSGALITAMAVTVYEGGVRIASARGSENIRVLPGETASIDHNGVLAVERSSGPTLTRESSNVDPAATDGMQSALAEIARLHQVLDANGISPATGRPLSTTSASNHTGAAVMSAHLRDGGETNLTPDEWRQLAEHGELRFRLPGLGSATVSISGDTLSALGIPDSEVPEMIQSITRVRDRLAHEIRADYRDTVGSDPGNLSMESQQNEIRDKTAEDDVSRIDWLLAQERGGLSPTQTIRPEMSGYERMMRTMVEYETQVEQALTEVVGASLAHELVFGEHKISGRGFGRIGHMPPAASN